jgi:phospholipid/cholesterol/gamma-HCH transport system substrate-binding protein
VSKDVSRSGLLLLIACAVVAVALAVLLNNSFGGPQVRLHQPYKISAVMRDPQGLLKKSFVLARGVEVGSVEGIEVQGDEAVITLGIKSRYAPIYRNATVRTGNRTLIGEPYIELDPGSEQAGVLKSGSRLPRSQVLGNVEFDEALKALDRPTIDDIKRINRTFARGFREPQAPAQINGVFASFSQVLHEARELTDVLKGQEPQIARLVGNSGAVLKQLGDRERSVRSIVDGGRQTLSALASQQAGLRDALRETPRLLDAGRRTLREAQPLLTEASPLIAEARAAAPDLTPALQDLGPTAKDAASVVRSLPAFNGAAVPALDRATSTLQRAAPLARRLTPALRNLVPILEYVEPRKNDISALFSNLGEFVNDGDAHGIWFRYGLMEAEGPSTGTGALRGKTFEVNPYPGPNGNLDPRGFTGNYPQLRPVPLP